MEAATRQALAAMIHRGPDEQNLISLPSVVLGHVRLSIIDLSASHQPMSCPEQRYWLSFNGEIYNYRQLKSELSSRWVFRTNGDTEVLLAGLVLYGEQFIERLEGMWAFAFWDTLQKRLLLSRDPFGKKPLYYKNSSNEIACASELPSLKQLDRSTWREDSRSVANYFRYGYFLPGYTVYEGVYEVLPGHSLIWSPAQGAVSNSYWQINDKKGCFDNYDFRGELVESLKSAVKKRLVSDVEVGAFLSGGIDSSLIVSLLTKEFKQPLKTFTVSFGDSSYDESRHAQHIAQLCGTEHISEHFDLTNAYEKIDQIIVKHLGQPFADASMLPTYFLSSVTAKYVKVVLSGDGADEVFSGYQRYQAQVFLNWYMRLPAVLRGTVNKLLRSIPEPMVHHSASLLKKAQLFVDIAGEHGQAGEYIAPALYQLKLQKLLCPKLIGQGYQPQSLPEVTEYDDLERMMRRDMLIYLPQDILQKVDRASMGHSLEARAPFLDKALVDFAFALPSRSHRRYGVGKMALKTAFNSYLPKETWQRRKQGFAVPLQNWFKGPLGDRLVDLAAALDTPLELKGLRLMLSEHRDNRVDYGLQLWGVYCYLIWKMNAELA